MSTSTTLNYKLVDATDSAAEVAEIINENFRRLAGHEHSGIDAKVLSASVRSHPVIREPTPRWGDRGTDGLFTFDLATGTVEGADPSLPLAIYAGDDRVYPDTSEPSTSVLRIKSNTAFTNLRVVFL